MRSNIRAQFDCSDAESLMYSFRGMLRGICDGEALLDSNLRIHVVSDCLKHLLMTSTNLHGKSFQQLLDPEDLEKFRQFMEASASNIPPNMSTPHMPPCLRVSLLGAASTRIAVDLFHVPISKLPGIKMSKVSVSWLGSLCLVIIVFFSARFCWCVCMSSGC